MIDLTPLFQAIILLLAALITRKVIPWIKSKTTKEQQQNLVAAARIAVYAAEQVFGAGQGKEKLAYALEALRKAGYNIDETLAREAIEKAVRDMQWDPAFDPYDDSDTAVIQNALPYKPEEAHDAPLSKPEEANDAPLGKLEEEDAPGVIEPPPDNGAEE